MIVVVVVYTLYFDTSSPLCQLHVAAGLAIDMEVDATGGGDVSKFEDMWHTEDMLVQASFMN